MVEIHVMAKEKIKNRSRQQKDPQTQIISACLKLAVEKDWEEVDLGEIAEAVNMPLSELYKYFQSKNAVLRAFSQMVDTEVLEISGSVESDAPPRDRLFELLMLRFDRLTRDREALTRIMCGTIFRDPIASVMGLRSTWFSMKQTLDSAGIETSGILGCLKVKGLTAVYLKTIGTWLKDDSPSLDKTMVVLDKSLTHAENLVSSLPKGIFDRETSKRG